MFGKSLFTRAQKIGKPAFLGAGALAAALSLFPGRALAYEYAFSYNFTTGPANQNTSGVYNNASISPWVFNSELANGNAVNAQMRYRAAERLPSGSSPDVGVTIRSRITTGDGGSGTMIYYGNDNFGSPFVMDLSDVGSSFTMTMGYAPNPAVNGIEDGGANVSNVDNQLFKMGMLSAASGQDHTLGTSPSLFISYREVSAIATSLPTLGSTTGYYDVRTTNSLSGIEAQLGPGTVTLQAMTDATHYSYYVYETTYTNVGYQGGEALFNIDVEVQLYSVDRTTFAVAAQGGPVTYTATNVDSDLDATELETMRVAMGYTYNDTTKISVTGSTFDYFSTDVVPEPAAAALLGCAGILLLPRRRRKN